VAVSLPGFPRSVILSWRPRSVLAVTGVWTALGLLSTAGAAFAFRQLGRPVAWTPLLTERLADWYSCAAFTPLFVWLARRWALEGRWWLTRVPAWLVVTTLSIPLKYALYRLTVAGLLPDRPARPLGEMIAFNFMSESMAFWAMIAVIYAVEYYDGLRQRKLEAATLKAELAEARLEALGAQLHPHFLFNTLQGISTLIHRDPGAADRMLSRLSDLLRRTLAGPAHAEVPLAEELEVLDHYLQIQQARFRDRLVVERMVAPGLSGALVPRFILQPLVENAIQHGIGRRAGNGRISITAERRDDRIILMVTDDGPGLHAPATIGGVPAPEGAGGGREGGNGIGLSNTRRRLAALYGDAGVMTLSSGPGGGLHVALTLPFRDAP
jgi:two-component system, LytTR family, sensor kinase